MPGFRLKKFLNWNLKVTVQKFSGKKIQGKLRMKKNLFKIKYLNLFIQLFILTKVVYDVITFPSIRELHIFTGNVFIYAS